MYIDKILPFLRESDFVKNQIEIVNTEEIYYPRDGVTDYTSIDGDVQAQPREFKAYHVMPCDIYIINENENICRDIVSGVYGEHVKLKVTTLDYMSIAKRIELSDGKARILVNDAYNVVDDVVTDVFISSASKGVKVLRSFITEITVPRKQTISITDIVDRTTVEQVQESALDDLKMARRKSGSKRVQVEEKQGMDYIFKWLDSYFALPEGEEKKNNGREVVPLLVGPTGVFKSATIKELCKKYDYRLVDFRVSFTSRLDYSGLFKISEIDGKTYSYTCPMEEIVTCSDGFREYCRQAKDKLEQVLQDGYIIKNKVSNGNGSEGEKVSLNQEQIDAIQSTINQYEEYCKTPVLFFDEVTRTQDAGVEGVLVQLLNQKKFNNMTLNGCKFVAATNLNLMTGNRQHDQFMAQLDDMYDVNTDLDVAYANRFMPLKVLPNDVAGRWYDWANNSSEKKGKMRQNIHPMILRFLQTPESVVGGQSMLYNDYPVLQAIDEGKSDEERKSQTFPNYRTWEMLSDYLYSIDDEAGSEAPQYRETIINGLISEWAGEPFIEFLRKEGYKSYYEVNGEPNDDVGDFLDSTLSSGVPALMIGPSSLGKCVSADTIIRVGGGICEIKDLEFANEGFLEKVYKVDGISDLVETSHTYREFCENVVRLEDNFGSEIKATKNHPLLVLSDNGIEWKRVEEIEVGDTLLSKRENIVDTEILSNFDAYMYGFVLGNDSIKNKESGSNSLTCSLNKERIKELLDTNGYTEYTETLRREDNFGFKFRDLGKVYKICKEYPNQYSSHSITEELWNIEVYNYTWGETDKKHFPTNGSYEFIYNVLAGYIDTDGYISSVDGNGFIEFRCEPEILINDLQKVLNSLGYTSKRFKKWDKHSGRDYSGLRLHRVESVRLLNVIKDLLVLKREQAYGLLGKFGNNEIVTKYDYDVDLNVGSALRDEINGLIKVFLEKNNIRRSEYKKNKSLHYFCNDLLKHSISVRKIWKFIEKNHIGEYCFDTFKEDFPIINFLRACVGSKVVTKEDIEAQYVYDVTIPYTHAFIANGFISHNTSRVKAYMRKVEKKTGLRPVLIDVNLATKDTSDLMGAPSKKPLKEYVSGTKFKGLGLTSLEKELGTLVTDIRKNNTELGLVDTLTIRAPGGETQELFKKALDEGREVILFFDECNRVTNPTIMSAMFECFVGSTEVKLLDGRVLSMEELYEEAMNGNTDLWTYSVTDDGNVIPAHISCVIKKTPTTKLVEIETDDGTIIRCTEDHKFMLKDGTYVMAKDLDETMDIMEVNFRGSTLDDMQRVVGYEIVSTSANSCEEFTHRIVAKYCNGWSSLSGKVIHHSDYNKRNNNPSNLNCSMSYIEHIKFHGKHLDEVKVCTDFEEKRLKGLHDYYLDRGRVEKANVKRAETFKNNPSSAKARAIGISETRKAKCKNSSDYKKSISVGLLKYNEKVSKGDIIKDYSHLFTETSRNKAKVSKIRKLLKTSLNMFGVITEDTYERAKVSMGRSRCTYPKYPCAMSTLRMLSLSVEDVLRGVFL